MKELPKLGEICFTRKLCQFIQKDSTQSACRLDKAVLFIFDSFLRKEVKNQMSTTSIKEIKTNKILKHLTQSQSKTPITRSVHCKFNCITVALDRTQHGFYIFQNVIINSLYKMFHILMGIETLFNVARLFVLYKLSFEYSSPANLINTFDDLFRHT